MAGSLWCRASKVENTGWLIMLIPLLGLWAVPGEAQIPLGPLQAEDELLAPFFEGWYENPDGSYVLSFGYFNRSLQLLRQAPLGELNRMEPAEYDGRQPTLFPPGREMGVFTITVPPGFTNSDVVQWTLTYNTRSGPVTHTVPGRVGRDAYVLDYQPMPLGSIPPSLRVEGESDILVHPMGVEGGYLRGEEAPLGTLGNPVSRGVTVGEPLELTVEVEDRIADEAREPVALGLEWFTHQGPQLARFEPAEATLPVGVREFTTQVSMTEPGEYILRVRVDNWSAADSSSGNQCCWTNGYVRVVVTP